MATFEQAVSLVANAVRDAAAASRLGTVEQGDVRNLLPAEIDDAQLREAVRHLKQTGVVDAYFTADGITDIRWSDHF